MVENNKYSISVPYKKQIASEKVSDLGAAYGMPGFTVNGNDQLAVYEVVKKGRERALNGEGPTLIEAMTDRLTAHYSDDDDRYREKEVLEEAKKKDTILFFSSYLKEVGVLSEEKEKEIKTEIDNIVNEIGRAHV